MVETKIKEKDNSWGTWAKKQVVGTIELAVITGGTMASIAAARGKTKGFKEAFENAKLWALGGGFLGLGAGGLVYDATISPFTGERTCIDDFNDMIEEAKQSQSASPDLGNTENKTILGPHTEQVIDSRSRHSERTPS